jgi:hypothetical protein
MLGGTRASLSASPESSPYRLSLENFNLGGKYLIFDQVATGANSQIYYGLHEKTKQEKAFKFYNFKELEDKKGFKAK